MYNIRLTILPRNTATWKKLTRIFYSNEQRYVYILARNTETRNNWLANSIEMNNMKHKYNQAAQSF